MRHPRHCSGLQEIQVQVQIIGLQGSKGEGMNISIDTECVIDYMEARRDLAGLTGDEWDGATAVIDWLKSYFDEILDFSKFPASMRARERSEGC